MLEFVALAHALERRFEYLTKGLGKSLKKITQHTVAKKVAHFGVKSIPVVGAIFTYSTAQGSQGERVARAVAGEIGVGPIDLETLFDLSLGDQFIEDMKKIQYSPRPFRINWTVPEGWIGP